MPELISRKGPEATEAKLSAVTRCPHFSVQFIQLRADNEGTSDSPLETAAEVKNYIYILIFFFLTDNDLYPKGHSKSLAILKIIKK